MLVARVAGLRNIRLAERLGPTTLVRLEVSRSYSYLIWKHFPVMKPTEARETRGTALKGHPKEPRELRISKTLSWLLRHGAQKEKLPMRPDGYARVSDVLANPKFRAVDFPTIERLVKDDKKQRYHLALAPDPASPSNENVWWIRANQGHTMKEVELELKPINSVDDIPSRTAVHGTYLGAWNSICEQGLSRMRRNHIHLAQGVPSSGSGVISGMRTTSQVLIYIDVQKAIDAGIKFFVSDNGVVLSEGNADGIIPPQFFERVVTPKGTALWPKPIQEASTPDVEKNTLLSEKAVAAAERVPPDSKGG